MAGRTPAEAVQAFVAPLQLALDCVTNAVLDVSGGYHVTDQPHALALAGGDPVDLAGDARLTLSVRQNYRIVESEGARGPWKVQTSAYAYRVAGPGGEMLVYHWHPQARSTHTRPHLHIGGGSGITSDALRRAHVPTGRIAVEELLRMLIEDLGVEPRRRDWSETLDSAQAGYEAWRTWPAPRSGSD